MYPSYCSKYFGVDHSYCLANCDCNTTSLKVKKRKKKRKKKHLLIWIIQWNPIDAILKYLHFMQGQYSPFHLRSYTVEIVKHFCHYEFMTKSKENKLRPKDPKQKSYVRHRESYCPWFLKDKPLSKGHILTFQSKKRVTYTPTQWRNQNLSWGKEFIYTTRTYIYYVNV